MGKKTILDIGITLGKTNCPFPSTRSNSKQGLVPIKPSYENQFVLKLWFTTKKIHLRRSRVLGAESDTVISRSCTVIWLQHTVPPRDTRWRDVINGKAILSNVKASHL